MRIVHIVNHTFHHNGNVHAAVDLACAQADLGHDVSIYSSGGSFDDVLAEHGVHIINVSTFDKPRTALRALIEVRAIIKRKRADIVHAHMMASAVVGFLATRISGARLVTTVHNAFERSAILMGLGDRVIAVSRAVASSMEARGISKRRLRVVLNGTIGTARYSQPWPPAEPLHHPAILFVGGLHDRKGIPELLTAFSLARKQQPDLHLYLVGEGADSEAYARSISSDDRSAVHFEGSKHDPRSYLKGADIFVLASRADPAPLVLSEAREAGLAIIATDVDGIPELLEDGKAGVLVPPQDPAALAEAISRVATNSDSIAAFRQQSQINIQHMSLERVAEETIGVYQEVVRKGGSKLSTNSNPPSQEKNQVK